MSADEQHILGIIGQVSLSAARQSASLRFTDSIITCMRQEKVGLEAAITKVRDMTNAVIEIEALDGEEPEVTDFLRNLLAETYEEVIGVIRVQVATARELIALADQP